MRVPPVSVGYLDTVEVSPDQVDMLGGQIIQVAGQCQEPYSTVYCRFDEQVRSKLSDGLGDRVVSGTLLQRLLPL